MVVWLRPECFLAIVTSLYYCLQLVSSKTYDKFWCATEEGRHQLSCPDEAALLTDVSIRKVYRRSQKCAPDEHSEYLAQCEATIDGSSCEGNKTCLIEISSRNYIQCEDKSHAPTYFYVKYTCIQIHIMCENTAPIRNTLYGFIVSPAYPHPMADNLKCSINIEADPSMFIELAPIQIRLQDAIKCRSEYLEIFGYVDSMSNLSRFERNSNPIWKSYHTWCGADRSTQNPSPNTRYLISSNSLYMSLHTGVSKKPRSFKIRYKVVPSIARSQYDADGIAYDTSTSVLTSSVPKIITSTVIPSTTIVIPRLEENQILKVNETVSKRTFKKEILIGVIAGIIVLVIAILVGIGIFLFIKRRRTRPAASKLTATSSVTQAGKKNTPSSTSSSNAASKAVPKTSDKAPLLERPTNVPPVKPKLVPERTVQIADVNTSRFKSSTGTTTIGPLGTSGKTTGADASTSSSALTTVKPTLTAADSGIYGADLSDDVPSVPKPAPVVEPPKIYGIDLPDKSESSSPALSRLPPIVVINPLSENSPLSPSTNTENSTLSAIVVPNNVSIDLLPDEKEILLSSHVNDEPFDDTVKSAYLSLIDATMSENEGTIGSASIVSSASQSRRTSNVKQPLLSHEIKNLETMPRKPTQFNPLHVILKKDANKYYTTEYI